MDDDPDAPRDDGSATAAGRLGSAAGGAVPAASGGKGWPRERQWGLFSKRCDGHGQSRRLYGRQEADAFVDMAGAPGRADRER